MTQEQIDIKKMHEELQALKIKVAELNSLKEDFEFARRTEEAWERIEKCESVAMEFDEFIKEIKKW